MLTTLEPTDDALLRVSARIATLYRVVPLRVDTDGTVVVAMQDPGDLEILDELRLALRETICGEKAASITLLNRGQNFVGLILGSISKTQLADSKSRTDLERR